MWTWIKNKWSRFKKWIIFSVLGVGIVMAAPLALPADVGNEIEVSATEYITAPENNTFKIGVKNFQDEFAVNITNDRPLQYKLDDKFISFKPTRMYFDGLTVSSKPVETSLKTTKNEYSDVFGSGVDLKMNTGQRTWEKLIKINSLKDLGTIPPTAQNLIIEFEIETNFIIDGWDKKTDLEITDNIRLGDFSYIKQASVWDSYREEVCEMINDEEVCDTLTNRQKVKTILSARDSKYFLSKHIPIDWLKTAQYPSETDVDVVYGTAQTFNAGSTSATRVTKLDTGKFAVCFIDIANGSDGTCVPASVSGTTITYGAESDFDTQDAYTGDLTPICATTIDTDKVAVAWTEQSGNNGSTRVNTVTYPGGTPTFGSWGTERQFESGDTEAIDCTSTATNAYTICYNDEGNSDTGKCVANTVSGTTVTPGAPTDYTTTDYHPIFTKMTSPATDKFVSCFTRLDSPNNDLVCFVGTVSATRVITFGSASVPPNGLDCSYFRFPGLGITSFGIDEFVLSFCDQVDDDGWSAAGTISTRTITWGTEEKHALGASTGQQEFNRNTAISATEFIVVFNDQSDPKGQSNYCTVDWADSSIVCSTQEVFEAGSVGGGYLDQALDIVSIDGAKVVICYQDDDDSDVGKCIIGDGPSVEPPPAVEESRPRRMEIIIID